MRTKTVSAHSAYLERFKKPPRSDNVQLVSTRSSRVGVVLTRSDIKVNRPNNQGYRMPSAYSARLKADSYGTLAHATPIKLDITPNPMTNHNGTFWEEGAMLLSATFNKPSLPPIDNLRMKILNNIRAERLDVAMVLAEIRATAETANAASLRIGNSMNALHRRDRRSFEYLWNGKPPRDSSGRVLKGRYLDRFNRQVSGMYLEWKYGVMPSVYDYQAAMRELDPDTSSLWDNPPILVARASDRAFDSKSGSGSIQMSAPTGGHLRIPYTYDAVAERKARCDFVVDNEGLRGLNRFGIGLGTIATIAYDKTPFSFVFNMVMPGAELIKAWTALAGVSVLSYCETEYNAVSNVSTSTAVGAPGTGAAMATMYEGIVEMSMERSVFNKPPMPMPYLRNPLKVGNAATVLALFTQLRRKGY